MHVRKVLVSQKATLNVLVIDYNGNGREDWGCNCDKVFCINENGPGKVNKHIVRVVMEAVPIMQRSKLGYQYPK